MGSLHLLLLFLLSLFLSSAIPVVVVADSIGQYCDKTFNGGPTQSNIDQVLADLKARASVGGFATSSYGKGNTTVFGLAQCRGDVSTDDCTACIAAAVEKLPAACPGQADARVWYDFCFARYDTDDFIGVADTGYAVILVNTGDATDPESFVKKAGALMGRVRGLAVGPGSGGLGRAKERFTPYVTIYGLAQCTRDLEALICDQCLASAVETLPQYCGSKKGCQILYSSCMVRYEVYPFFFPLDDGTKRLSALEPKGRYDMVILRP